MPISTHEKFNFFYVAETTGGTDTGFFEPLCSIQLNCQIMTKLECVPVMWSSHIYPVTSCFVRVLDRGRWIIEGCYNGSRYKEV